ncbi:hypothetical protein [Streptomyces sp. RPT161]|uniref:hypothetical protein n=1 Tax=Streptomyces sp. RPT161 TaxID=3015993 RepID=UPI0022B8967D|nr:hypothetical protein [Streptomyces sp. RPT161]
MDARWAADAPQEDRSGAVRRRVRLIAVGAFALLWCWAVLRVAVHPAQTGPVEQGFAVSGWTLGLLPVHVTPWRGARCGRRATPASTPGETGRAEARGGAGRAPARPLPTPRRPGAYTPVGATAISAVGTKPRTRRPVKGR